MLTLWIEGHDFHYEMENLCRLFFPYERIATVKTLPETEVDGTFVYAGISQQGEARSFSARIRMPDGREQKEQTFGTLSATEKEQERKLGVALFHVLQTVTGETPAWGILTGIHPVKLYRQLCAERGESQAQKWFREKLLVSEEKIRIAQRTMEGELPVLQETDARSFSLYISIPFCPTRCSYCSFVSQTVERSARLIPEYVKLLCQEILHTAEIANALSLRLESVYIGGGTPTTLDAEALASLIDTVRNAFDLSACREFTVEAGRPDTITLEKLQTIRQHGADRISINPQTMNETVLRNIGRKHTVQAVRDAYRLARGVGFSSINMDLIAGLPGDTPESFAKTLQEVISMAPENITVHALALKHAAKMMQEEEIRSFHRDRAAAERMIRCADQMLSEAGYRPYYLYRQSRTAGNLENTGWAKPGFEGHYNVYTMEECHTILACGAGAVSKIKDPYSDRLERIFNFKYSYEYVSRHAEMMARKDRVKTLYEQFRQQLPEIRQPSRADQ